MHFPGMMAVVVLVLLLLLALLALLAFLFFRGRVAERPATLPSWTPRQPAARPAAEAEEAERDTFLIMPDISGYTQYLSLNRFSLGHAQHIISELLETLMRCGAPRLALSKIEGDAILFYAEAPQAAGPPGGELGATLVDLLAAFYARRKELEASNLCPCNACRHIGDLDLKIVVHRGPVLRYHLGEFQELSGLPVIAVHRLLKSSLHLDRYLMITEAAGAACRLPAGFTPREHVESYEGIGEVAAQIYEFEPENLPRGAVSRQDERPLSPGRDLAGKLRANARTLRRGVGL